MIPYRILEGPVNSFPANAVFASIFSKNLEKILLVHKTSSGSWGLPGGKVEKGEQLTPALLREIKEETSLEEQISFASFDIVFSRSLRSAFLPKVVPITVSVAIFRGNEDNAPTPLTSNDKKIDGIHFFPTNALPENLNPHHAEYIKAVLREVAENENLKYAIFCLT